MPLGTGRHFAPVIIFGAYELKFAREADGETAIFLRMSLIEELAIARGQGAD
jgi:hypothetical protein